MNLDGARVLLIGASGGLGHAIARAASARGANLVLTGRRTDVLEALATEVDGRALPVDFAQPASIETMVAEAGDVDVVIASAGVPATGLLTAYSVAEIDHILNVNLRAPVVTARLVCEGMVARGRGHLVFISSISGKVASPYTSLYNASKFGLRGFSLALREELRPYGVGVSAVYPGFIRDAGVFARSNVKLPRGIGTSSPDEVANAVVRAVEQNVGEIDVLPVLVRISTWLATLSPRLSAALRRRLGSDRFVATLAEARAREREAGTAPDVGPRPHTEPPR